MAFTGFEIMGIISFVMTVIGFTDEFFPRLFPIDDYDYPETAVRVQFAHIPHGGGFVPDIRGYDVYGNFLGKVFYPDIIRDHWAGEGAYIDGYYQSFTNVQPVYVTAHRMIQETLTDTSTSSETDYAKADDDGVCIAYISSTWPDGSRFMFLGSLFKPCEGINWSPSQVISSQGINLDCVWLDGDRYAPANITGFQVIMSQFTGDQIDNPFTPQPGTPDYCKGPALRYWTASEYEHELLKIREGGLPSADEISEMRKARELEKSKGTKLEKANDFEKPDEIKLEKAEDFKEPEETDTRKLGYFGMLHDALFGNSIKARHEDSSTSMSIIGRREKNSLNPSRLFAKESHRPRSMRDWLMNDLIISDSKTHSAKEICTSKSSRSPDFVSTVEGKFCDMETRTLWDLCDGANRKSDCFDVDKRTVVITTKRGLPGDKRRKAYQNVEHWPAPKPAGKHIKNED